MLKEYFDWSEDLIKDMKKPVIGWTCAYMPEEVILAAGAHPFRLQGKELQQNICEQYLPNFFCPYGANIANTALAGGFDFLAGVIFTNSCNAMERVYDVWKTYAGVGQAFMLDVPRNNSNRSKEYYKKSIRKLINSLEKQFQIKITDSDLQKAIKQTNQTRALLNELSDMCLRQAADITTEELLKVIEACSYMERERYNEALAQFVSELKKSEKPRRGRASRIMLSGCVLYDCELIQIIKKTGAVVIGDELCTGSRYYDFLIKESGDPVDNICDAYLSKSPCPRMEGSASTRANNLLKIIDKYDIDAVIYHSLKFCINHSYDYMQMKELLNDEGIPVLLAESDFSKSGLEQLRIRVEAFMEMLS
ncbi:MAG TPA: hypothetical protein DCW90_12320 [Lachnospiraceae bacterium]|nr:2-hydroxyacyl-CoA dehydratase family protein [uncultured Lachnoclostridium sp.]HAU86239.1 hypothetical protein [Lachnospiraceae bacterium]